MNTKSYKLREHEQKTSKFHANDCNILKIDQHHTKIMETPSTSHEKHANCKIMPQSCKCDRNEAPKIQLPRITTHSKHIYDSTIVCLA